MAQYVEFAVDGRIALARLNRPERLNALNAQMQSELTAVFNQVDADPAIRVLILTDHWTVLPLPFERARVSRILVDGAEGGRRDAPAVGTEVEDRDFLALRDALRARRPGHEHRDGECEDEPSRRPHGSSIFTSAS